MADSTRGFKHAPAFEPEPFGGAKHSADDRRCGVVSIEGGGAGGTVFFVGQKFRKLNLLLVPVGIVHVEHLWQRTPADIFYE